MVSESKIKKYAWEKMGYTGKITPYIKEKVIIEMNKEKITDIPTQKVQDTRNNNEKTKKKSGTTKKKVIRIVGRISKGVGKTVNVLGEYGDRFSQYYDEIPNPKTVKRTVRKTLKKPVQKKLVRKSVKNQKKPVRKTTRKQVRKTVKKSIKSVKNAQRDFEDELMKVV